MSFYGKQRIPMEPGKSYVFGTIFIALFLTVLISPWRLYVPPFLGLVIAWWSVRTPSYVTMGLAMVLGAMLDIVNNDTLGVSMIELLITSYVMGTLRYRFEIFSFIQQSLVVMLVLVISSLPKLGLIVLFQDQSDPLLLLLPSVLGGFLWTFFVLLIVYPLYRPVHDALNTHQNG